MSIAGIASSSNVFQSTIAQQTQNRFQQIQSQFQKLGQDLQSGNLTQAQSDFATLTQELPNGGQFGNANASATTSDERNVIHQLDRQHQSRPPGLPIARQRSTIRQSQRRATRLRHHPAKRAASASFRPGASRPSSSPRRRQRLQHDLSDLHTAAGLHFAGPGSAIRQSLDRAAGLRLSAIRLAAIPPQLCFRLNERRQRKRCIRNHRRQRHCLKSPHKKIHQGRGHKLRPFLHQASSAIARTPSPETNRRIPNPVCFLAASARHSPPSPKIPTNPPPALHTSPK